MKIYKTSSKKRDTYTYTFTGIDVWDHIIIAGGSGKRYSMAEQGKMQEFRNRWKEAGEFVADPLFQPPAKEQRFGKHL